MTWNLQTVTPPTLSSAFPVSPDHALCLYKLAASPDQQFAEPQTTPSYTETDPSRDHPSYTVTLSLLPHVSASPFFRRLSMQEDSMTFKSMSTSGTSSSKASSLFDLDENGNKPILVYKYRSGAKGLEMKTEHDLCVELDQDPNLPFIRVTKKPIPRGNSRLDILGEDLMLPDEREKYSTKPTLKVSVANVGLPRWAKWKHMILGSFEDLYIVSRSPTQTPDSSQNNSPESSQHVSPSTTFPSDNPHSMRDPDV